MARVLLLTLGSLVLSSIASASDGVIEINQAVALAGAVNGSLLADPPNFPVVLTVPGSYRLTGNLDVRGATGAENVTAISVETNGVSIDLAGFAIYGPTVCTGTPPTTALTCAPTGLGDGIQAAAYSNVSIFGGTVSGAGHVGVSCGLGGRIERMHVENSGSVGVAAGHGSLIFGNTVNRNSFGGIASSGGATIRGNSVGENGGFGVLSSSDIVEGNTVQENRSSGISASWSTVAGNSARSNYGTGITVTFGGLVIDNTVIGNQGAGLSLDAGVGYGRNVMRFDAGGSGSGGLQIAPNLCETALCP